MDRRFQKHILIVKGGWWVVVVVVVVVGGSGSGKSGEDNTSIAVAHDTSNTNGVPEAIIKFVPAAPPQEQILTESTTRRIK